MSGPAEATSPLPRRPVVIAHRGASGDRPEHTLSAYRLAVEQGADYIEPDLVVTRDGVLVCRHETEISATTDVAARPEFASRRTLKTVDGQPVEGWFAEDFTLAELKTLRCRERIPQLRPANTAFDGEDPIPTLQELLDLARGARVGVYCELKHPTDLAKAGHDTPDLFVRALERAGLNSRSAPVWAECFEVEPTRRLRALSRVKVTQLVGASGGPFDRAAAGRPVAYRDMVTDEGLREIARYADGVGAEKSLILPRDAAGASLPHTDFCRRAHQAGLQVHAWTFRSENAFLPVELRRGEPAAAGFPAARGDGAAECALAFRAGVDGLFSDHPAAAVAARNQVAPPVL
mgnify:FL=1